MQTLKDVFKREDERLNLINVAVCVALIVAIVSFVFGLTEMKFAFQSSPPDAVPAAVQATEGN